MNSDRASAVQAADNKKAWAIRLKVITFDTSLKPMARCVAFTIYYGFLNHKTGETFVGQDTLGQAVSTTDRTIRDAVDDLERRGHITVARHKGPGGTNIIRFVPATDDDVKKVRSSAKPHSAQSDKKRKHTSGSTGSTLPLNMTQGTGNVVPLRTGSVLPTNLYERNLSEEDRDPMLDKFVH